MGPEIVGAILLLCIPITCALVVYDRMESWAPEEDGLTHAQIAYKCRCTPMLEPDGTPCKPVSVINRVVAWECDGLKHGLMYADP